VKKEKKKKKKQSNVNNNFKSKWNSMDEIVMFKA